MTWGIWEMVEDASVALSPAIGAAILEMMEKQIGFEIAGENPRDAFIELGRIFIDEFGYAAEVKATVEDNKFTFVFSSPVGLPESRALEAKGVKKAFSNPVYCVGIALLKRFGYKCRVTTQDFNLEANTITLTFEAIE